MKKGLFIGILGAVVLLGTGCKTATNQNVLMPDRGAIQVSLDDVIPARSTQARLDLTLQSSRSEDSTASLTFAQLTQGGASIRFDNLPPGVATISATLYGKKLIGTTTATASVLSNQVTRIPLNIKMADTQPQAGGLNFDLSLQEPEYSVALLAGSTATGSVDATGALASFARPLGIAVDASGNAFVADTLNHLIRKISPAGEVTTLAGSTDGYADGKGNTASFSRPASCAVDASGNVFVADTFNHRIRKISPAGEVTTLAGSIAGYADGKGNSASFFNPQGVAVDASGNVFVADTLNHRIRKISPLGEVTTLAGNTNGGHADGTGGAASFVGPMGIAVDARGYLYVSDSPNCLIRKISPAGEVTTLAGSTPGHADGTGSAASFTVPTGIAVDSSGNLFVADSFNHLIRKITPVGVVTTLAGSTQGHSDGTGAFATFYNPVGIAVDARGILYVADSFNHLIRKMAPSY